MFAYHSAEFCLFEAVYPLPFGHPLLQGGRSLRLFQYSVALLIFMRRPTPLNPLNLLNPLPLFRTQSKGDTPQGQPLNPEP